ncbi:hypothetical protein POX_c04378 [Penicillium oxalicum]|uniref:Uncharacterized protein n=1 Tax=Penicillium oxalicum (strain 114-2 / CGMCC 5302) TaxID=933388 RepID=S8AJN1_PENO1|nr:hypothetical protein POX_c04378 [Penicillium oxalicum]EPS26003.1 hypothetical protein PDE_00939 [Penicillium oxalicum 114-2]KAI2791517.1 hypothetical protein POX_c04378 [Penicillium oxalicum]
MFNIFPSRQLAVVGTRTFSPIRLASATSKRSLASTTSRFNAAQQPSAYRQGMANYKTFAKPFSKVFLGAVLTYQLLYWTWLKLETDESKLEKNEEMSSLEKKARELAGAQK